MAGASGLFLLFDPNQGAGALISDAALGLVDTQTGAVVSQQYVSSIPTGLYAPMALWGGHFYFFSGFSPGPVTRFNPVDGSSQTVGSAPDTVTAAAAAVCTTSP